MPPQSNSRKELFKPEITWKAEVDTNSAPVLRMWDTWRFKAAGSCKWFCTKATFCEWVWLLAAKFNVNGLHDKVTIDCYI